MGHGHVTPNPDGSMARCGGPGICPTCNQEAATAGFYAGGPGTQPQQVTCPNCQHTFEVAVAVVEPGGEQGPVRMTEADTDDSDGDDGKKPYGDVEYADPGYQEDGKSRYPIDTEEHVRAAWSYINQARNAEKYSAEDLAKVKARIKAAADELDIEISDDDDDDDDAADGSEAAGIDAVGGLIRALEVGPKGYEHGWKFVGVPGKGGGKSGRKRGGSKSSGGRSSGGRSSGGRSSGGGSSSGKSGGSSEAADKVDQAAKAIRAGELAKAVNLLTSAMNAAKTPAEKRAIKKQRDELARKIMGGRRREAVEAVEAMVNGRLSFTDIAERVQAALRRRLAAEQSPGTYVWVHIVDLTTTDVVYCPHISGQGDSETLAQLFEAPYSITPEGEVTLGDPRPVVRSYSPAPESPDAGEGERDRPAEGMSESEGEGEQTVEARVQEVSGRVLEALPPDEDGGRVFRMRILAYGESRNRRRYTESVMAAAAHLYEGARAYDHHRTEEEMRSSTTAGLIGYYRNVEAEGDGIYGDLHLLPSATQAAEALDASLALQEAGLPPLLGVSHDVMGHYRPVMVGGRRVQEATAIAKVHSVDLVADPAAGGKATRMVAGGTDDHEFTGGAAAGSTVTGTQPAGEEEDDVPPSKQDILGALAEATDEELAGVGLARARATESGAQPDDGGSEGDGAGQGAEHVLEASAISAPKTSWLGKSMIREKVSASGLPEAVIESLTAELPDRITEADVDSRIAGLKSVLGVVERAGLAPTTATVQVTQESLDKKIKALDAFFEGRFGEGYYSFRQAFTDFTGMQPRSWGEDFNRTILRESFGAGFDARATESLDSTSWAQVLGDSVTRRMMAMYRLPSLQSWRQIVSSIVPVNDFRTQRISRVGGYGVLPEVAEGAPYQPLNSPPDEEATYAITKRGGTEDLTLEMIANDDVRAIANIPTRLGRAAAQTLYRFVWDLLRTNAVCTYDNTALFHSNHANTDSSAALSETTLSAARVAMAQQVAYGDDKEILSLTPKFLVIPAALETVAFKLTTSAVAVSATEDSTTPNIHRGTGLIKVDYFDDDDDWFLVADPEQVPTIEIGFYQGREEPELFTQSDPNVGSMFNADKFTYKIRHPYSGTILDHRGFYRGAST